MSPALRVPGLRAERLPPVPAAAPFMPAAAILHAPAVQQTERAPDLIPDPDLTQDPPPQAVRAIPAEQRHSIRQTVRKDMAGAVPVALPLLHNVKYVLKEVLWEDTATVLSDPVVPNKSAMTIARRAMIHIFVLLIQSSISAHHGFRARSRHSLRFGSTFSRICSSFFNGSP